MIDHCSHLPLKFSVYVKDRHDKLPMMYWLARFIANSSSCTTTELSKLLTSCLTAVKTDVIRYCKNVNKMSGKSFCWSIKNSGEVFNKLKMTEFRVTSLSTYDFSTLYTGSGKLTKVQLYMATKYQPDSRVLLAFSDVEKHFFFIF